MPTHPLAEVFGFPTDNHSPEARRYREHRLCPFNNRVPNCTKDKANDPLGVCSVYDGNDPTITCPVRFREQWIIVDHAATFFFPAGTTWTSLTEVRLHDRNGRSAGNIDVVLVSYDDRGRITDFGALEVQAVYISGSIRPAFAYYMEDPQGRANMDWNRRKDRPRPDYLSSSRKRLAPQLIFKGGILKHWGKKQAVAIDQGFFRTLPALPTVEQHDADIAWLIYDLQRDAKRNVYQLTLMQTVYTRFEPALIRITTAEPGPMENFVRSLQRKLNRQLESTAPDAPTLTDIPLT